MSNLIRYLEKNIELSFQDKQSLIDASEKKCLLKNDVFLQQGRISNKLSFLERGAFRMFHTTEDGDEANTEFILSNGFITDFMSFLKGTVSQVSIAALEDSEITILNIEKLEQSLIKKLAHFGKKYVQNVCLPVLLDYQIIISEKPDLRYEILLKKYPEYIQKIPQKHIASYLRLRPETLSRIRRKFLDLNQLKF